jgi:hypothetical protein
MKNYFVDDMERLKASILHRLSETLWIQPTRGRWWRNFQNHSTFRSRLDRVLVFSVVEP